MADWRALGAAPPSPSNTAPERTSPPAMTQPRKSTVRTDARSTASRAAAATDVAPAPDVPTDASAEPVARYTWEEIRSRVAPADAALLASFPVAATPSELSAEGALIRSERILTDLRLWLGDILDWWTKLPAQERSSFVGFSDARLRVVAHHGFTLLDLVGRAGNGGAKSDHAAAVAVADTAYAAAQRVRGRLRALLDQAALAAVGFAESVTAADAPASDAAALDQTLGALIALARKTLKQGGPVAGVLAADGLTPAALDGYAKAQKALRDSHEKIRGAAGAGPVTQSALDQQDGLVLLHMGALRATFRALHADDRRAPLLVARSTSGYFGRRARKPAAPSPAPADGGKSPAPTK